MEPVNIDFPSTWRKFKPSLCKNCWAGCCTLPLEVSSEDLHHMGFIGADEVEGSLKKVAKRLIKEGIVESFRARTGIFTIRRTQHGDCIFLDKNRMCKIYDKRPSICRRFPECGPRPGYCPHTPKS